VAGKVIMYADQVTDSMRRMMDITDQRRESQLVYNRQHGITPRQIVKEVPKSLSSREEDSADPRALRDDGADYDMQEVLLELEREMLEAAGALEFERAAILRDEIDELKQRMSAGPDAERPKGQPYRRRSRKAGAGRRQAG
jgi:excinuclease ABC subunit B